MRLTRLIPAVVACAAAPWAMAQSVAPESGVLVTHTNSQQWEVRLISGGQAEQFSGIFESNQPVSAVSGLNAQGRTSAKLLTSTSVGATLSAAANSSDGATFTVG